MLHDLRTSPIRELETRWLSGYVPRVNDDGGILSLGELRARLRPFCQKHRIRRLDVFGSAARGQAKPGSDVDLLVTLDQSTPVSTPDVLEMAGEVEELVGTPVDFVLRASLEDSPNHFAREHVLSTAVCVYGS
jgi:predicted nucleotidyltransferase